MYLCLWGFSNIFDNTSTATATDTFKKSKGWSPKFLSTLSRFLRVGLEGREGAVFQTTARTNTVWAFSILELCTSGNREAGIAVFSLGLEIPEPAKLNQLGPVHAFLRMKFFSSSNINTRTSTQERVETGGNGGKNAVAGPPLSQGAHPPKVGPAFSARAELPG